MIDQCENLEKEIKDIKCKLNLASLNSKEAKALAEESLYNSNELNYKNKELQQNIIKNSSDIETINKSVEIIDQNLQNEISDRILNDQKFIEHLNIIDIKNNEQDNNLLAEIRNRVQSEINLELKLNKNISDTKSNETNIQNINSSLKKQIDSLSVQIKNVILSDAELLDKLNIEIHDRILGEQEFNTSLKEEQNKRELTDIRLQKNIDGESNRAQESEQNLLDQIKESTKKLVANTENGLLSLPAKYLYKGIVVPVISTGYEYMLLDSDYTKLTNWKKLGQESIKHTFVEPRAWKTLTSDDTDYSKLDSNTLYLIFEEDLEITGDINGDGIVDESDYTLLQNILNGVITENNYKTSIPNRADLSWADLYTLCDLNNDSNVDNSDLTTLGNLIGYVVPTDSSILDLSEYTTNYSEGILTLTGTVTNQILNIQNTSNVTNQILISEDASYNNEILTINGTITNQILNL